MHAAHHDKKGALRLFGVARPVKDLSCLEETAAALHHATQQFSTWSAPWDGVRVLL